jgi:hypothetical protein
MSKNVLLMKIGRADHILALFRKKGCYRKSAGP